ncbi:helix-turn-helix domain-containing protein [Agrococcus jenensis]|uniref:Helix-turn-helix protein n=1 Tax=Agrococcus jenensis TaxID=46353 RepID=A0A3N2ASR3_9MICO|nr:helix-turn-helix transcriptional regulator [Agrococcus jenensis]ROR66040.1 helix-turn-helix protein [Agrococcus jenensis]
MSIHLRGASASERQRYGELVRPARVRQGLSQKALAALADVDRTTVSNIERGSGAPQEDVLRRLFAALGLATDAQPQDPDVELWTAVMAELLSNVPPDRRHLAADAAIATLAAHVRAGVSAGEATVTAIADADGTEEHLHGLAARRGSARRDEPHAD